MRIDRNDLPAPYLTASQLSARGQSTYVRLVRVDLLLVLGAAAISVILAYSILGMDRVWAAIVAVFMVVSITLRVTGKLDTAREAWFTGRSKAESVKSISWLYMAGIPPFDEETADSEFTRQMEQILTSSDTDATTAAMQPTLAMQQVRRLPLQDRLEVYLNDRLRLQRDWYVGKSAFSNRQAKRWKAIGTISQALTLLVAILVFLWPSSLEWVGLLAAISAASTAWVQLRRYDEIAKSYELTASDLGRIEQALTETQTSSEVLDLIKASEATISREHRMWISKRRVDGGYDGVD